MLLLLFILPVAAQVHPAEGDSVHYRLIPFSFAPVAKVDSYVIEVAEGSYKTYDSFAANLILRAKTKISKPTVKLPSFGVDYTWRVLGYIKGSLVTTSGFYHFVVRALPKPGVGSMRLSVAKNETIYKDALVFLDRNRALYDMSGELIWFLPKLAGQNENSVTRDIKMTPQGTITFLSETNAYEINYNGDVLWKAPTAGRVNGEKTERYHHEFTRLGNGRYMALSNKNMWCKLPAEKGGLPTPTNFKVRPDSNAKDYRRIEFASLIEYDSAGKIVWTWKLWDHFSNSHFNEYAKLQATNEYEMHINSFYFDERAKMLYLSSKNYGIIIKISYPKGDVVAIYGSTYNAQSDANYDTLFCAQHAVRKSAKGYLYVFNNNICNDGQGPKVLMFIEPASRKDTIRKIWEYNCPREGANRERQIRENVTTGGCAFELPNSDMFICLCSPFSNVSIVSREKEVQWSAFPEQWSVTENKWVALPQYRASIITDAKAIENLVRGGVKAR